MNAIVSCRKLSLDMDDLSDISGLSGSSHDSVKHVWHDTDSDTEYRFDRM